LKQRIYLDNCGIQRRVARGLAAEIFSALSGNYYTPYGRELGEGFALNRSTIGAPPVNR
jgi:hypothetical protein